MDADFLNLYIRKLVDEITELNKQKMILLTRTEFAEAKATKLEGELKLLQENLAALPKEDKSKKKADATF